MADHPVEPRSARIAIESTTFVGRTAERRDVRRLLAAGRLVTLTGVAGVGKTRLALRVARDVRSDYPDGLTIVELSPLGDPRMLGHTVARALGLSEQTNRPELDVLTDFLAGRRLLLLLDTCEHLAADCASLALALLRAAPGLRILITSRRVLAVPAESVCTVRPLPVPAEDTEDAGAGEDLTDAVRLFLDRAAAADPGFRLTAGNKAIVTGLCRRLEGLPLAIELAAVRLSTLPVQELARRLDDRFQLLRDEHREGSPRHRALGTAIGWSHELCEPLERLLWARLSVFAGHFDLTAAEFVCADGLLPVAQIHELLAGLVGKSIVLRDGTGYRLLDSLREYGLEWLRRLDEEPALRRRHRAFVLELAREFDGAWCGPDQVAWADRLITGHADLRAALDFCLSVPDEHAHALDLAGRLFFFWYCCGFLREGRDYLDRVLALPADDDGGRARALWVCAVVAMSQGDFDAGEELGDRCERLVEARPDSDPGRSANGWVTLCRATAAAFRGEPDRAVALAVRSITAFEASDDPGTGRLIALANMAFALLSLGELEAATVALDQHGRQADEWGEVWARSYGDYVRSLVEAARGDMAAAQRHARAALAAKRRLRDRVGIALALDVLAEAAAASGDPLRAARLLGIGLRVWQSFGRPQLGSRELVATRLECERRVRALVGDVAYENGVQAGRALGLDAALAYALGAGA